MSWSPQQIACVDAVRFEPCAVGYVREDVERMRRRAALAMRAGRSLPDVDAMVLRRTVRGGVSVEQVDGLRTVLAVWRRTTPVDDPQQVAHRMKEAELATLAGGRGTSRPWSSRQMDVIRDVRFGVLGRTVTSYDEGDVDDYLDAVIAALRDGTELPDPAQARFRSSGLRRGYDPREVDDFLDEIARMRPEG